MAPNAANGFPPWAGRVPRLLGVSYPVVLGPMRLITLGEMAAAVSNAGGFGVIAASGLSNDRLRAELKTAREKTAFPIGVNIPIYRPNALDALEIAIENGVNTIYTSAGNPAKVMGRVREAGLTAIHKVSDEKTARKAEAAGVDAVVAMGQEAGGHIGRDNISTMCLVPLLADMLSIPVIAAGGIADARGVAAALALGAEGVEIGTRLVATTECPVPAFFKEMILSAGSASTLLLGGEAMPIRVLKNRVTMRVAGMPVSDADSAMETEGDAAYVMSGGDAHTAVMPCGQIAGVVRDLKSVGDVMGDIIAGIRPVLQHIERMTHDRL